MTTETFGMCVCVLSVQVIKCVRGDFMIKRLKTMIKIMRVIKMIR